MADLPAVSGRTAIRAFEKAGFVVLANRGKGSHCLMRRPEGGRLLTIPVHSNRDLATGTLRSLIRAADLTIEQFVELL